MVPVTNKSQQSDWRKYGMMPEQYEVIQEKQRAYAQALKQQEQEKKPDMLKFYMNKIILNLPCVNGDGLINNSNESAF